MHASRPWRIAGGAQVRPPLLQGDEILYCDSRDSRLYQKRPHPHGQSANRTPNAHCLLRSTAVLLPDHVCNGTLSQRARSVTTAVQDSAAYSIWANLLSAI